MAVRAETASGVSSNSGAIATASDQGPAPTPLRARTTTWYVVPLTRSVVVCVVTSAGTSTRVQFSTRSLVAAGLTHTSKPVIGDPPSPGVDQVISRRASPRVTPGTPTRRGGRLVPTAITHSPVAATSRNRVPVARFACPENAPTSLIGSARARPSGPYSQTTKSDAPSCRAVTRPASSGTEAGRSSTSSCIPPAVIPEPNGVADVVGRKDADHAPSATTASAA